MRSQRDPIEPFMVGERPRGRDRWEAEGLGYHSSVMWPGLSFPFAHCDFMSGEHKFFVWLYFL